MVKQDAQHAKALTAHLKKLVTRYKPDEPPATDPVVQVVLGFLNIDVPTRWAEEAYDVIMEEMVDHNELRVSSVDEVLEFLAEDYPEVRERLTRLRVTLHELYIRERAVAMTSILAKPKKEQRQYLNSLPGITPYVAAQVQLLSLGGTAVPVDEKICALLIREDCLVEGTTCAAAEAFILKHVKAADAMSTALALQAWADACKLPAGARTLTPATAVVVTESAPAVPLPAKTKTPATKTTPASGKSSAKSAAKTPAPKKKPAAAKKVVKKKVVKKKTVKKKTVKKKTTKKN